VKDTDAGDGVSMKHREEGNGKPPTYFSRVNNNDGSCYKSF